jgi:hypothetical protein
MVFPEIAEHISERVTRCPRRRQSPSVPTIGPEPARPRDEPIHAPGNAHHQASHPHRKRPLVAGLDEQMEVIRLHGEVDDPKNAMMTSIRGRDGTFQRWKDELRAERSKCGTQRHVHWLSRRMLGSSAVRRRRTWPRFSPGPLSPPTPSIGKLEFQLMRFARAGRGPDWHDLIKANFILEKSQQPNAQNTNGGSPVRSLTND